jgi:hypothetical protein
MSMLMLIPQREHFRHHQNKGNQAFGLASANFSWPIYKVGMAMWGTVNFKLIMRQALALLAP